MLIGEVDKRHNCYNSVAYDAVVMVMWVWPAGGGLGRQVRRDVEGGRCGI